MRTAKPPEAEPVQPLLTYSDVDARRDLAVVHAFYDSVGFDEEDGLAGR